MAKFNLIQNTFRAGKISPKVFSRTDLQLYYQGCEVLENLIPRIQGGVSRRPGTQFWLEAQTLPSVSIKPRILPYNTAAGGSYIIVLSTGSDFVEMYDFSDGSEPGITKNMELPPFISNSEVQFVQKDDVMLLTHANMPPSRIFPDGSGSFTLTTLIGQTADPIFPGGVFSYLSTPYLDANASTTTLTASATTGTWSGTGTGVSLTASVAMFDATMVFDDTNSSSTGTFFRTVVGGTVGYFRVREFVSTTVVRGDVLKTLGGTGATTDWAESAWSRYRGYPRSVCIFEQRAYYGGTKTQPLRLWGSQLNNIYQMHSDEVPATVDELAVLPYAFDIYSEKYSFIQWMTAKKELTIGTNRAEFTTTGRDTDFALGPDNFKSTEHTNVGSAYQQPIKFDNIFLFLERDRTKVREFTFDLRESGYRTIPLNYLTDPLLEQSLDEYDADSAGALPVVTQWCTHGTFSTIWMIDSFGKLLSLTRDRTLDIVAFADHPIGGEADDTPIIHSICSLDNGFSEWVVMLVERKVNGVEKLFLERFSNEFVLSDFDNLGFDVFWNPMYGSQSTPEYLDCCATVNNVTPTDEFEIEIMGVAGCDVHVVADGKYLGIKTLTRLDPMDTEEYGLLTLDEDYKIVTVGFNYYPYLVTVPVEAGAQLGSAQGRPKRIDEVVFKFFKSVGAKFGFKSTTFQEIIFRNPQAPIGDAIQPFTGDKILKADHSYSNEKVQVYVKQDQPLPFYLCSVTMRGQEND